MKITLRASTMEHFFADEIQLFPMFPLKKT